MACPSSLAVASLYACFMDDHVSTLNLNRKYLISPEFLFWYGFIVFFNVRDPKKKNHSPKTGCLSNVRVLHVLIAVCFLLQTNAFFGLGPNSRVTSCCLHPVGFHATS